MKGICFTLVLFKNELFLYSNENFMFVWTQTEAESAA